MNPRPGEIEIMNIQQFRNIGKNFVELHKDNEVNNWVAGGNSDNDKYLEIYYRLAAHDFGEVVVDEYNDEYNNDDNVIDCTIQISSHDSKSGIPILFEFQIEVY